MGWADFGSNEETRKEYLARVKYERLVMKSVKSFHGIVASELEENVQYRFVTTMAFNAITVLEYLRQNYTLIEVYVVVFRMNNRSFDFLSEIIKDNNLEVGILVSNFFLSNSRYERWANELMSLASTQDNVRTRFLLNHAKLFLGKTKCGKHIVFEGSGNLSDNSRIEQYIYEKNKTAYEFHKQWINELLDEAK